MTSKDSYNRRDFLSLATWAIGGLVSAAMGIPAIAYLIGPALKGTKTESWIHLSSAAKIEFSSPSLFKAKVTHQTGWIVEEAEISAFVLDHYKTRIEEGQLYIGKMYRVEN